MKRLVFVAAVLLIFSGIASATDISKVDGYYWNNASYQEKASVVIDLVKSISATNKDISQDLISITPENVVTLCLITDSYYSSSKNIKTSLLNAWLVMARQTKA